MNDSVLTVEEVCELYRFRKSYVYNLTHKNEIPHFKIGNHVRFLRSEVDDWFRSHARGNDQPLVVMEQEAAYARTKARK